MKILVVGSNGQVGKSILRLSESSNVTCAGYDLPEIDITSKVSVAEVFNKEKPELVINAAAFTAVDKAEEEVELAYTVNDSGTANLAEACENAGVPFFHISTDYVFDGTEGMYIEDSAVNPESVYGASKLAGEISAKNYCSQSIILRTSWVFSEYGGNFVKTMIKLARTRDSLGVVADQKGSPTSASQVAEALLKMAYMAKSGQLEFGTYHFTGAPYTTWHGFALSIFEEAAKCGLIDKIPEVKSLKTEEYPTPAKRPPDSRLDCSKIHNRVSGLNNDWRVELKRILNTLQEEGF